MSTKIRRGRRAQPMSALRRRVSSTWPIAATSYARLGGHAAAVDRAQQRFVVPLVLFGVGVGEVAIALSKASPAPSSGDRDAITGPGVRSGQRPAAHPGVERQPGRCHVVDGGRTLPVPELADVVVARHAVDPRMRPQPSRMSLAACMRRWPATTRSPWLVIRALAEKRFEHRRLRLLDLQEKRVMLVLPRGAARSSSACRRCRRRRPCAPGRRTDSCSKSGGDPRRGVRR